VSPGRPEILLNCAVSVDGRLAYSGGRRAYLSGPEDLARVQGLRAGVDAIAVGVGTVLADDPSLRVHWELLGTPPGPAPTRVVFDSLGRTPETARVLDRSAPTVVLVAEACRRRFPTAIRTVTAGRERVDARLAAARLAELGFGRVLVEGGGTLLSSLLREGLWDRLTVYIAPVVIGGTLAPSLALGPECPDASGAVRLRRTSSVPLGPGTLVEYRPEPPDGPSGPL